MHQAPLKSAAHQRRGNRQISLPLLFAATAGLSASIVTMLHDLPDPLPLHIANWFPKTATDEETPAYPALSQQHEYLIRSTLLALDAANRTGNYSVLRDVAAPSFQAVNTAHTLFDAFRTARETLDLSTAAMQMPVLSQPPARPTETLLHLSGQIAGTVQRIGFDMVFEAVSGHWRLAALAVGPVAQKQ